MEGKTIKLKAAQFEGILQSLQELNALKMPIALSYWMGKNMKSLSEEARSLGEAKQKLLQESALIVDGKMVPAETPGQVKLIPEKIPEYWKQMVELDAQEIEVKIYPININKMVDKDGKALEVQPMVLVVLDFMFEGEPIDAK